MRVQRNENDRVDLIKRVVEEKNYYTARLYGDIKPVEVPRMNEDGSETVSISYDCDMVITQTEIEFVDDTQAMYFYESNFDEEYRLAKYIEDYKRKLDESLEARQLLDSFDYVPIKMGEAAMKVLKALYKRRQEGSPVSFEMFLDEFVPTILALEKDKGGDFLESRENQRRIASGRR